MTVAAYGTWESLINGEYLASKSVRLSEPVLDEGDLFWLEGRPEEKGRTTIVSLNADGETDSLLPPPWNARSMVHEYGGGSYCVTKDMIFFVHAEDQQIYLLDRNNHHISQFSDSSQCRFADLFVDSQHRFVYAICEDHNHGHLPHNRLVRFPAVNNGIQKEEPVDETHDFISNPRVSPNGCWLTYLTWDNPNMPWDNGHIWLRKVHADGALGAKVLIAGSGQESVFQPQWNPNGDLYWVSDSSNWWNIKYAARQALEEHYNSKTQIPIMPSEVFPLDAEFATPQWVFGMSTYAFLDAQNILATYTQNGLWFLCELTQTSSGWIKTNIETTLNSISNLFAKNGAATFVAAGATSPSAIYKLKGEVIEAVTPTELPFSEDDISSAQPFEFATSDPNNPHAYGFYYPPKNQYYSTPENTLPPLIVVGHGGPTGCSSPSFNYKVQYWTHRGFAVVDVNYRGSTGYGRQFRHALNYQWGVADVEDLCNAAKQAVTNGWAAPNQLIIRGSSAGGFSVLAALTDSDTFNAGVSLYGIGDLELLAKDTHKFEAKYLDNLIGPYPKMRDLYQERSPINKIEQIKCPLLLFQGLQDKVVPPNQAETMVEGVKQRNIPVAYVTYAEEGHGFRGADNICHQVEAELYFYQEIFKLTESPENHANIVIQNWPMSSERT